MSTFSDVKGSASGSSISRLAPAFQSLHFSCIIPPTSLKYNLLHFPAEVLHATSHRRFPGVLLSQSLLRLRPIRPIHQAPAHWTHFVFLSILSNLSAKPWDRWWDWMAWKIRVKGRGGGQFGWRSLFLFSSASLPTHLLLEVRWGSSRGYWLLYCGRLVTGKSGRSHYHQQAPSQVHMALAVAATGLLRQDRTRVLCFD